MRAFSYGGGVQSTAALVLAARGDIDFPTFVFANVGDDSEHPDTLRYVTDVAGPFAAAHGIDLVEVRRTRRDGSFVSLWERLTDPTSRSLPIPVRMSNGAPGTRSCTASYKIEPIGKWLRARGATTDTPATIGIGISLDEIERTHNRRTNNWEQVAYPLIDLRMTRQDCVRTIQRAGLAVPHKSACFFCPFHRMTTWQDMKRDEPDLYRRSVALETILNTRRDRLGKDHVYLTRYGLPLDQAVGDGIQGALDFGGPETCDDGYCFT